MPKKLYWKSLQLKEGKIVSGYDGSPWIVGAWRDNPYPVKEACEGLNACPLIADAMRYVNCEVLAQVAITGVLIKSNDKVTAQRMRIVKAWNWEKKDSVAMASYVASLCEANFNKAFPNDPRVKDCNALIRKWISDPTSVSDDELSAAESAARSAAWSAAARSAWSAAESAESARAAARSAAARASAAAWSAWSAAESAESAWSAARSAAARAAESAAAARSAWSAARAKREMKETIQKWIIEHLKKCKEL